jgi:hypothetical protein
MVFYVNRLLHNTRVQQQMPRENNIPTAQAENRGFIVRSAAQQRCVSTSHTEEELFAGLFSPPLPSCLATQFLVAARQLEGEEGGSAGG